MKMKRSGPTLSVGLIIGLLLAGGSLSAAVEKLSFDHNYTFAETVRYLNEVIKAHPKITELHTIGKSYLGKDLLVLEITNQETGQGLEKPGFWIDGNLHSSEVMGAAVCLKTIETLVTGYGSDASITELIDTRTIYIMPKLNPDGSDHYLTRPDGMRSSVRPHDSDRDGLEDEDPGEDLNGDGYITQMRVKSELGGMKTSSEDPRLMVRRTEEEKGEWQVYSEGIDNDKDGRFNEDGVGGLDINRNWPSRWQQEYVQRGSGRYPLSEPETRAVAEFLFAHPNVTGVVNHHMSGNFLYRPPTNRWFNPVTGVEDPFPRADEAVLQMFGRKYSEIINQQPVRNVYGRAGPPTYGAIWGVMIGWAYDHLGVYSWVPEMGSLVPFCDYDKDGRVSEVEQLKWNDEEMDGRIFVDWKPFDHPQLGKVEIGGFTRKLYHAETRTYTNVLCTPGPKYFDFLEKHAEWNLYLASMSPLVRVMDIKVDKGDAGYVKVTAEVQNLGFLPTNVSQHAIDNRTAKPVRVYLELEGASLFSGKEAVDLGHLPGTTPRSISPVQTVEWVVKTTRGSAKATVKAVSEKGGTHTLIRDLRTP
jgi:hypothetical protein